MAQRTVIRLVDDLDDTEIVDGAGETVNFVLDGRRYEIDLTDDHANEMRAALDRYVRAARKGGGRGPPRSRPPASLWPAQAELESPPRRCGRPLPPTTAPGQSARGPRPS